MAMEARLSLRQSQRVVMTPLLQQAIQLLQLSTLELQEVVQKELLENPLLEELNADGTESPTATTALTWRGTWTSTPVRTTHDGSCDRNAAASPKVVVFGSLNGAQRNQGGAPQRRIGG